MAGNLFNKTTESAVTKIGTSIVEKLLNKGIEAVKDQVALGKLWQNYERQYLERFGRVKLTLSGMREAVSLEDIYTGVRFLDDISIGRFASIESLEQDFREQPRRLQQRNCTPQDGMTVANRNPLLMVLGGPGAGKSTYLRRVGLEAIKGNREPFEHDCIPVMLELKQFAGEQIDIQAAIIAEFSNVGFDFSEAFVEAVLQEGRLLVLLDGLDEVPRVNQDKVIQAIQDFVSRYHRQNCANRFIASCRIAAHKSSLPGFKDIELADFNDDQIRQFIDNWFQSSLDQTTQTASKCWELLDSPEYASAKELAQTPLLLTFLCVVYDRTQAFPANRAALYRKAIDILLEEWAAEKRIRHEPIYEGLNTELEKVLLAEIAYQGFVEDRLFFTREELIQQIQTFLEDSADKPKYLDGKSILNAIAVQQGILTERAEGIFSFSHLTVQEYLTAQYLSQHAEQLGQIVHEQVTVQRWREVFILVSGLLLPSSDDLITQMIKIAQGFLRSNKLLALLDWAEFITNPSSTGTPKYWPRKSLAIFLACNRASRLASELASELANTDVSIKKDIELAQALAQSRSNGLVLDIVFARERVFANAQDSNTVFNRNVDFAKLRQVLDECTFLRISSWSQEKLSQKTSMISKLYDEVFYISSELLNLSEEDWDSLRNHLYISELIIQCKNSAVRVSRLTWDRIETQILNPLSP